MRIGLSLKLLIMGMTFLMFRAPDYCSAAEFKFRSETILRSFERDIRENDRDEDKIVVPAYEYFQIDGTDLFTEQLSFHAYGWGRYDFANSDYYDDSGSGEFLYGYLQYLGESENYFVRVGRQYIFPLVTDDSVDGALVNVSIYPFLSVMAFGGLPVALDEENGVSGNYTFGGRISNSWGNHYQIGAFYRYVAADSEEDVEEVGVDLSLYLPLEISVMGRSKYNLESGGWAEHAYEALYRFWQAQLQVNFDYFELDNFLLKGEDSANPFRFLADTDETILSFGGELVFNIAPAFDIGTRFTYYDYDKRMDSAQYYSALGVWRWQQDSETGLELGYMNGDDDENRYFLGRAYVYKTFAPGFVTGDIVYAQYLEDVMDKSESIFVSLGVGKNFLNNDLAIKLSGDFSSDPFFDTDFRGMLNVRYNFGFSTSTKKK